MSKPLAGKRAFYAMGQSTAARNIPYHIARKICHVDKAPEVMQDAFLTAHVIERNPLGKFYKKRGQQ
ncbi:hypothetical protein [Herbaspirillum huttiense]|uniref:Uncharacterized protein n=2 Tax=Herbaspirillum huttiense TaxID=863372 RepID=A0AAJ2HG68_9BURK|nr:hypothetical protein [Herbaspirillum huttiense]MDR9839410.1 hypothetical protein [Herbaspirillum huttiense]